MGKGAGNTAQGARGAVVALPLKQLRAIIAMMKKGGCTYGCVFGCGDALRSLRKVRDQGKRVGVTPV